MDNQAKKPSYGKSKAKLIQAAIECVMENGADGCSARKISRQAGVSVGLIHYHYPTLQGLIADAYKELALSLLERAIKSAGDDGSNPQNQLSIFLKTAFDDVSMNRRTLRAWIVFWGMIEGSPLVREAHDISNHAFADFLEEIFNQLNDQCPLKTTPRLAAIGLTAMMDGLWLEWSLQSGTFSALEARELCELWIESLKR